MRRHLFLISLLMLMLAGCVTVELSTTLDAGGELEQMTIGFSSEDPTVYHISLKRLKSLHERLSDQGLEGHLQLETQHTTLPYRATILLRVSEIPGQLTSEHIPGSYLKDFGVNHKGLAFAHFEITPRPNQQHEVFEQALLRITTTMPGEILGFTAGASRSPSIHIWEGTINYLFKQGLDYQIESLAR